MGMSTSVYGIRKPDDEWKKRVKAWKACEEAGVNSPAELESFFDNLGCLPPDGEKGPKVNIEEHCCCEEYKAEMEEGFEIDLKQLTELGFTHLRFVNSY